MRKTLLLVVFTMVLSIVFSTAAIAYQSNGVVVYGNSQSGSVSFGDHGYAWYHSNPSNDSNIYIVDRHSPYLNKYYKDWKFKNVFKRWTDRDVERCYYVDDNGVSHYFYLDRDREYDVVVYNDKSGVTQYYFKDVGRK